jgi:hypothetical protein
VIEFLCALLIYCGILLAGLWISSAIREVASALRSVADDDDD